jgi:FAD/FMN-containing dehydrogenase/Fe-S oxidoreductase
MTSAARPTLDVRGMARALADRVDAEVRFDEGSRALYATDASNYRQVPIGVVIPRTVDAIVRAVAVCREFGAPVVPRGNATSLAGQCCNAAVVLDTSKYLRRIIDLDPTQRRATVEPGVVLDQLRAAARVHGLTFAPDPSTHLSNTIGGMIGNNSCGVHALMGGKTGENVEELEVLTYDGARFVVGATTDEQYAAILAEGGRRAEVYRQLRALRDRYAPLVRSRYPNIPRRVSGYNLPDLLPEGGFHVARALVGSEGTCVLVLRAVVRLIPDPPVRVLAVLGYPDIFRAADDVPWLLEFHPIGLEAVDQALVRNLKARGEHLDEVRRLPEGGAWLLVEFGGSTREEAEGLAQRLTGDPHLREGHVTSKVLTDPEEQRKYWLVREAGLAITSQMPDGRRGWPGWEDSAVSPAALGAYVRDLWSLWERYRLEGQLYGHFGQGCVHTNVTFDLQSREGLEQFRAFMRDAADLVLRHGGSLSGEHGDGQARGELLGRMFGPELVEAFREFKRIWDPLGRMNPGKVVDPAGMTDHLRIPETYRVRPRPTALAYPEDGDDFGKVTLRCVGIAKCRKLDGGVMCPSYMATREERYSTRGRARLLYEMAQDGAITEGWRSPFVRDALDLCLSCKGCKTECPVHVDMAAYKAEFLSHYYRGRLRPRAAYALGLSYRWLPLGSRVPGLVNRLAGWSPTAKLLRSAGGIAPERRLPALAPRSFRATAARRGRGPTAAFGKRVLLWTDTWNNFLHPEVLAAAEEVLTTLGYRVELAPRTVCCGRPLYDFGMLDRARRLLRGALRTLGPALEAGVQVVVLEPSCLSVFREELPRLLPGDPAAVELTRSAVSLSELVDRTDFDLPPLGREVVVQPHCHEASVLGTKSLRAVFRRLGATADVLDAGCCGMAGSFGMEAAKYPVSVTIAERGILPRLRASSEETLVVADGFSCREQISSLVGRPAVHTAEVLRMALHARESGPPGPPGARPTPGDGVAG